jgi:hypothetical protein
LGVVASRLLTEVFGISRCLWVSKIDELARNALIVVDYALHLLCGEATILAEFAGNASTTGPCTTAKLEFREPCIAVGAFPGE